MQSATYGQLSLWATGSEGSWFQPLCPQNMEGVVVVVVVAERPRTPSEHY